MKLNSCLICVVLSSILSSPSLEAAVSFLGLGDLAGGAFGSGANGVSSDGSTVVGSGTSASGTQAFRWTLGGGMTGLGYLAGASSSTAYGVSGDGSTIVGGSGREQFRWTSAGGIEDLNFPFLGGQGTAYGVSDDGSVVAGVFNITSTHRAFRWTNNGGLYLMGGPSTEQLVAGRDISGDGSTVVGVSQHNGPGGFQATRWTGSSATGIGLGDLPGGGTDPNSAAYGVSKNGSEIVGYGSSSSGIEAFLWTATEGMVGLGDLAGGGFHSEARAVSGDGSTIVGFATGSSGREAFLWDELGGMQSLKEILQAGGADMTGWQLSEARGISHDGRVIVGSGINPAGQTEAWMANLGTAFDSVSAVPEPSSALGLGALLGLGVTFRRRLSPSNPS